jgi:hypothetical protein
MSLPLPGPASESVLPDLAAFRRPRLRDDVPLLWRGETSIQLGDDVVVDRVTRSHVAWMTTLDGLATPADLEESLTIPEHEARRLVRALLAAGALDDAARIPAALRWARPEQRDAVAGRFGAALRTSRDLDAAYATLESRDRCLVAITGDGPVAEAVATAMAAAGLPVGADQQPTVAVLADAAHPDVPRYFDHDLQDRPHLHIGVLGDRAVVGPLVVPGETSCLRCAYLHLRDADVAWPLLSVQWAHAVQAMPCPPLDPLLVQLAATQAGLLLRRWTDAPTDRDGWSGYALDLRLPDGIPQRVARPAHPLCGCLWPSA